MQNLVRKYAVFLIIAAAVIVGVVIVNADATKTNNSSLKVAINKSVQDKCLMEVKDSLFCKFAGTWSNVPAYKSVISVTNESGKSQMFVTIAANGDASMSVDDATGVMSRVVRYAGETYIQDATDNAWQKYVGADESKPAILDIKAEFVKNDFKADDGHVNSYINRGTEKIGNLTCYKYQIVDTSKPDSVGYMWFDNQDYLLRKLSSKDSTTGDMEITFSYLGTTVSLPSPIKGTTL